MSTHGFTLDRTIKAGPGDVWSAWTEPERLESWFANLPPDLPTSVDLRVGGRWCLQMRETDDRAYVTGGIYREIEPGRRLSFTWGAPGGFPDLDQLGDDAPLVTVTLAAVAEGTDLTLRVTLPAHLSRAQAQEWFDLGIAAGWQQTLDRLALPVTAPSDDREALTNP
jgi:uncharacterized protein YndB with AHSA1/START domain